MPTGLSGQVYPSFTKCTIWNQSIPGKRARQRLRAQLEHADEETLRKAHGVASLTETFRQELVALGWQPASRVFVIPDAYDDAIYFPATSTRCAQC